MVWFRIRGWHQEIGVSMNEPSTAQEADNKDPAGAKPRQGAVTSSITETSEYPLCKTCGGTAGNHRPSVLDKDGIGHPSHEVQGEQPTTNEAGQPGYKAGQLAMLRQLIALLHYNPGKVITTGELQANLEAIELGRVRT